MLRTADLDYELPGRLLAIRPADPRDAARLMVVPRAGGPGTLAGVAHRQVRDLPSLLEPGDLLVLNTTRVLPARFLGVRVDTGAHVQGLFVSTLSDFEPGAWNVLLKMRRFKEDTKVQLLDRAGTPSNVILQLIRRVEATEGSPDAAGWLVHVQDAAGQRITSPPSTILEQVGLAPLPPYILSARKHLADRAAASHAPDSTPAPFEIPEAEDRAKYQTVYSDPAHAMSVAAPTAGLHFTPPLLDALRRKGVRTANVVLHVSLGTFKPVESEFVEQHPMHAEWCTFPAATARAIESARQAGRRVIAVGTTTARTLESFEDLFSIDSDQTKATRLLITPGYHFKHIDGLMTNFHLPRSTLLSMVAAFLQDAPGAPANSGLSRLLALYAEAIRLEYRFYSYGDAMLIL